MFTRTVVEIKSFFSFDSRLFSRKILWLLVLPLAACSFRADDLGNQSQDSWLQSGSIVVARQITGLCEQEALPPEYLAFAPGTTPKLTVLRVDLSEAQVELLEAGQSTYTLTARNTALKPGRYQVLHKQRNAPWYAPDQYFTKRGLAIPAKGSKERFLRGALGQYAVFIGESTPLYSSLAWSEEVGGLRLSEQDMARIYYKLPVGAEVIVK